ncbi:MAG: U32 family peptidase [Stappiaceae bacterium]
MELTVGPNQFFWKSDQWSEFYDQLARSPVDRVVIGELVCSKRLPYYQDRLPGAITTLLEAGKKVSLTSLALITLKRERKSTAELVEMGMECEVNDLTTLAYLPKDTGFTVGPLVNVYNESTLRWLAERGAKRICLPPELPLESVEILTAAATKLDVAVEIWGYGRVPLAISGRCYHARLHGRTKDNCQFACEEHPDGLAVRTLEDQPFLTMNGVQTLSDTYVCASYQLAALEVAGVSAIRLSPQSTGFVNLCDLFRQQLDGVIDPETFSTAVRTLSKDTRLSDGFLLGTYGADWSGAEQHT